MRRHIRPSTPPAPPPNHPVMMPCVQARPLLAFALLALVVVAAGGCTCRQGSTTATKDAGAAPTQYGLTQEQAKQVLAKIGDTTITVGDFAQRLSDQSPYLRARYNSPDRRREFLDNLVRFELLAKEAHKRGLDKLPEVERTRDQVMVQQMMKDLFENKIQLSDITGDQIRSYYDAHHDEFHKPEQVRASQILIKNEAKAKSALAQIKADPTNVDLFRQLVEKDNEDPKTKDRFGDMGFFARPGEGPPDQSADVPPPVAEAAFQIDRIGGVYPELVKTDDGFHIIKLTGRRPALDRSLEQARRPIQNRLWREKREKAVNDFVASLRKKANIQENLDLLSQVHINLPDATSAPHRARPRAK